MDPRRPCFFDGAALSGQAAWNGAFLYKKAGLWGPRAGGARRDLASRSGSSFCPRVFAPRGREDRSRCPCDVVNRARCRFSRVWISHSDHARSRGARPAEADPPTHLLNRKEPSARQRGVSLMPMLKAQLHGGRQDRSRVFPAGGFLANKIYFPSSSLATCSSVFIFVWYNRLW